MRYNDYGDCSSLSGKKKALGKNKSQHPTALSGFVIVCNYSQVYPRLLFIAARGRSIFTNCLIPKACSTRRTILLISKSKGEVQQTPSKEVCRKPNRIDFCLFLPYILTSITIPQTN